MRKSSYDLIDAAKHRSSRFQGARPSRRAFVYVITAAFSFNLADMMPVTRKVQNFGLVRKH